jgi:hypothetical protein
MTALPTPPNTHTARGQNQTLRICLRLSPSVYPVLLVQADETWYLHRIADRQEWKQQSRVLFNRRSKEGNNQGLWPGAIGFSVCWGPYLCSNMGLLRFTLLVFSCRSTTGSQENRDLLRKKSVVRVPRPMWLRLFEFWYGRHWLASIWVLVGWYYMTIRQSGTSCTLDRRPVCRVLSDDTPKS